MGDILKKVHIYDKEELLHKYKLDLWSLVYLLIKGRYLDYSESVFSLKRKYELEYNKKEIKRSPSSDLDTNIAIEKKLKSLGYVEQNGNIIGLTNNGKQILKEIDIEVNGKFWEIFEMFINQHQIFSFLISILSILIALGSLIISYINFKNNL